MQLVPIRAGIAVQKNLPTDAAPDVATEMTEPTSEVRELRICAEASGAATRRIVEIFMVSFSAQGRCRSSEME